VLDAAHGLDAVAAFERADHVDLLLSDVVMPQLGGRPLVERLRRSHPDLPALLMSGYSQDDPGDQVPLIQKPFDMTALVERVRAVLDDGLRRVA
jgi:CheY-like chemotaxis protein